MHELVSTEGPEWGASIRGRSPTCRDLNAWGTNPPDDWTLNAGSGAQSQICIDGRDTIEEQTWWDPEVRLRVSRPGPGILPTLLAEKLHDSNHSLFTVTVTPPDITPSQSSVPSSQSSPSFQIPTNEEVHEAVPHPNALYCRKENGWILLLRRSASKLPPLAPSFDKAHPDVLFPAQDRRLMTDSCLDDKDAQPFGQMNLTHHFHIYPRAVSSLSLSPPFEPAGWDTHGKDLQPEDDKMEGVEAMASEDRSDGLLLDLYVCCQCSVFVMCSALIPGIIPSEHLNEFVRERAGNPMPGQTGHDSAILALDTTMKYAVLSNFHAITHPPTGSWKTFCGETRRGRFQLVQASRL